jgi:hypothetical protein
MWRKLCLLRAPETKKFMDQIEYIEDGGFSSREEQLEENFVK